MCSHQRWLIRKPQSYQRVTQLIFNGRFLADLIVFIQPLYTNKASLLADWKARRVNTDLWRNAHVRSLPPLSLPPSLTQSGARLYTEPGIE